jgi:TIGR03009 family protein
MRLPGWSLVTVLLIVPAVLAQQPQPAPPLNPAVPDPLLGLLQQWEQKMKSIGSIQAEIQRTHTDTVVNQTRVFVGTAKFLRDPERADLHLKLKDNPQVYERFLFTGTYLYEFRPKEMLVRVHTVPQRAPGRPALDDNFLGLLFGMSVQETQRRYQLELVKTDANYYYIVVTPRLTPDKAEFTKARLALWQQTLLPRQIDFVEPNGNRITWDIVSVNTNARLTVTDFQRPQLPKGWQTQMVPPPAAAAAGPGAPGGPPPSKVRPSGGS